MGHLIYETCSGHPIRPVLRVVVFWLYQDYLDRLTTIIQRILGLASQTLSKQSINLLYSQTDVLIYAVCIKSGQTSNVCTLCPLDDQS